MQIDQEIRYFEEWSRLWRKGWILKIAKTGNVYILYETEYIFRYGMNDGHRKKWVKPHPDEKHEGFMIVENLPRKKTVYKPRTRSDGTSYERCEHTEPIRKGHYCEICGVV